ncbi:hypothetical protein CFOL_v3_13183, partial [Cephalotus follicularis]
YYSTLTHLWQQFDSYRTHKPSIVVELLTYQKDTEKESVYAFLGGHNPEYDPIRVKVLGKEPFPTLREANNLVQHKETHRNAMLHSLPPNRSALATLTKALPSVPRCSVGKPVRHCV